MTLTIIKSLEEFYHYIDANVFRHADAINLQIDIEKLNDFDKYKINLIVDSLKYTIQSGKIVPFYTDARGNCYPNISMYNEDDIGYLLEYINISVNIYNKATLNHLLFIKAKCKNKIDFAKCAINNYLELFEILLQEKDDDKILELSEIFNNLVDLAFKVNYKINEIKLLSINIVKTSNKRVIIRDAAKFLIEMVKKKKFDKVVLNGFIKIFKNYIEISNDNINWIECFIKLGREVCKIKNGNLIQWDLLQAKAYENEMNNVQQISNNEILAATWCKDAIKYYKKAKIKKKANALYRKYCDLCNNTKYASIKTPAYNLKDDIENIENYINKSDNIDILKQLIYGFIPKYEHRDKFAKKNITNSAFINFCPITYTDIYGQVIGYADTDEEKFKHELWNIYSIDFQINSKLLFNYIQYAIKVNKLSANLILEYLKTTWLGDNIKKPLSDNKILEYQWLEHVKEPIISYFEKQQKYINNNNYRLTYINEVDSITLKIEGILRDLVDIANIENFSVRKFIEDARGRQISNWKSINELLWDPNILVILPEDDVWFMRYFLTDSIDLRNNIAHCLILNPYQEQYCYGFQWLLIILLRLSLFAKTNNS